jgi:hypothetical protein
MVELDAAIAADREVLGKNSFDKKDDGEPPRTKQKFQITTRRINHSSSRMNWQFPPIFSAAY